MTARKNYFIFNDIFYFGIALVLDNFLHQESFVPLVPLTVLFCSLKNIIEPKIVVIVLEKTQYKRHKLEFYRFFEVIIFGFKNEIGPNFFYGIDLVFFL